MTQDQLGVPIPPELTAALDRHFDLSATRRDPPSADHRLWPWHRANSPRPSPHS